MCRALNYHIMFSNVYSAPAANVAHSIHFVLVGLLGGRARTQGMGEGMGEFQQIHVCNNICPGKCVCWYPEQAERRWTKTTRHVLTTQSALVNEIACVRRSHGTPDRCRCRATAVSRIACVRARCFVRIRCDSITGVSNERTGAYRPSEPCSTFVNVILQYGIVCQVRSKFVR